MTVIQRNRRSSNTNTNNRLRSITQFSCSMILLLLFVLLIIPDDDTNVTQVATVDSRTRDDEKSKSIRTMAQQKLRGLRGLAANTIRKLQLRERKIQMAVQSSLNTIADDRNIPTRLRLLRNKHEIIGERLSEITMGVTNNVYEILHGHDEILTYDTINTTTTTNNQSMVEFDGILMDAFEHYSNRKRPMEIKAIIRFLNGFINDLEEVLLKRQHSSAEGVWNAYHDLAVQKLYPWDRDYLSRIPVRSHSSKGNQETIFVSIVSFRDESCVNTLQQLYEKAKYPNNIYVGLVQQNCYSDDCKSGILANFTTVSVKPDDDCYAQFCLTEIGQSICSKNTENKNDERRIRVITMSESQALGPYFARYMASKLWYSEHWYMQIDSHMSFVTHWDTITLDMLRAVPSEKPILSHYPQSISIDLETTKNEPTSRLCGPVFASNDMESQIIRIEGSGIYDKRQLSTPAYSPFLASGYFVAHSNFVRDVPYDPFLPWIFMGEDILVSARVWTAGYDLFAPNQPVISHNYVRPNQPRFWESIHRSFPSIPDLHNQLQLLVIDRIKYQLGYPESARDMIYKKSILTAVEQYSMGDVRGLEDYLTMVGINVTTKEITYTEWCEKGYPPPGME